MNSTEQLQQRDTRSTIQRMRVPLGFVTAILFVVFSQPTWRSLLIGAPLALAGVAIRAWASGHLHKNAELTVSGPYAHTRNPLYFGSFLMAVGSAICGGSWWLGTWLVVFFLAVYWPVMKAEALHMQTLFSEAYPQWAAAVPLFLPRLSPYKNGQARAFDLRQYWHHREYRALIGLTVVIVMLTLKAAGVF